MIMSREGHLEVVRSAHPVVRWGAGQIRKANLCRGLGNRYTPAGTEVLISAVAHNTPPPLQAAQNATTVNTRSSVAPCTAWTHV